MERLQKTIQLFLYLIELKRQNLLPVEDKDFNVVNYTWFLMKIDFQYIIYLFLPLLFSVITICLSIFLYRKKKEDPSVIILIYFLLSVGVCYLSASTSARGDTYWQNLNNYYSSRIYSYYLFIS